MIGQARKAVTKPHRDAGAIPAASTFSEHASTSDRRCQRRLNPPDDEGVASHHGQADLRQETTVNVGPRPVGATKSATIYWPNDPDLAVVLAAWPELPEAVRAGIVAMVKAGTV